MWIVLRTTRLNTGGSPITTARFVEDTEAGALALSQRLNRASAIAFMTTTYPEERRGADHDAFIAACVAELEQLDAGAPPDSSYTVAEAVPFTGPEESSLPHAQALMQSYQSSANPPANIVEAVFRVLRDLGI